jgi:hypothetical protein
MIGQNVWERDQAKVEPFVAKMGDKMAYRVAMDDTEGNEEGKMAQTWMAAAGQNGIPCSFVVGKDLTIQWIGHPMQMEEVLKQVIAGTYDAQKAAAAEKERNGLFKKLDKVMRAGKTDEALAAIDEFEKTHADEGKLLNGIRFSILLQKKDYDAAYKVAATLGELLKDEPQALNELAWTIAAADGLEKRDLDLAGKLAEQAVKATESKSPEILDTLAEVHFRKGEIDKAVAVETDAVAKATGELKDELQKRLEKFQQAAKTK